jgi:hypothetical protein
MVGASNDVRPKVNLQKFFYTQPKAVAHGFVYTMPPNFSRCCSAAVAGQSLQPRVGASSAAADIVVERLACGYETVRSGSTCDFRDGLSVGKART